MIRRILAYFVLLAAPVAFGEEKTFLKICEEGIGVELVQYHLAHPDCILQANTKKEALVAAATSRKNCNDVVYLLRHHADPDLLDSQGRSALDLAVQSKDDDLIEVIASYASIHDLPAFAELDRLDWALRTFAKEKDTKKVKDGIERFRKRASAPSWNEVATAMEKAVDKSDMSRRLLSCFSNVGFTKQPALRSAILAYAPAVMEEMLPEAERQKLARLAIELNCRTLYEAVNRAGFKRDAAFNEWANKIFYDHSADVKALMIDYRLVGKEAVDDAVQFCAQAGSTPEMLKAIAAGGKIDAVDQRGATGLMMALGMGRCEAAILLLEAGADVNRKDNVGRTVSFYAKTIPLEELRELLLEKIKQYAAPPLR